MGKKLQRIRAFTRLYHPLMPERRIGDNKKQEDRKEDTFLKQGGFGNSYQMGGSLKKGMREETIGSKPIDISLR